MTKTDREKITLSLRFPAYAGYADLLARTPLVAVVRNGGKEVTLDAEIACKEGLIVPYARRVVLPAGETELRAEGYFSPLFLAENDAFTPCTLEFSLREGKRTVCCAAAEIVALPYGVSEGLAGDAARTAAFVRPAAEACGVLLEEARRREKRRGGADGDVRGKIAALFSAVKARKLVREEADLSRPLPADCDLETGRASEFSLALLFASCLERAGLHPVLAYGARRAAVGAWLYDACFLERTTDDSETVKQYAAQGGSLCLIGAGSLFTGGGRAFSAAERSFQKDLRAGEYAVFTDVSRCRAEGISPLPARVMREGKYVFAEETPAKIPVSPAPPARRAPCGKWERALADLSAKNPLVDFRGKDALHLRAADGDALMRDLRERPLRLLPCEERAEPFGFLPEGPRAELVLLEQSKGCLRAFAEGKELLETGAQLFRRGREEEEERGNCALYFAAGFLEYGARRAPIALVPARIRREREGGALSVSAAGEAFFNVALAELLRRDHGVDTAAADVSSRVSDMLSAVKAVAETRKGWKVFPDIYLAAFSFPRLLMWKDIHTHIAIFRQNPLFAALEEGKPLRTEGTGAPPSPPLLPLPADSSQEQAVALSATGASFVLHGPPGTGKSQTIANIIANAVADGKRVLFVAEKRAALEVVKRRLDEIGMGDFCLDLQDGMGREETVRRLKETLALERGGEDGYPARLKEYARLKGELEECRAALFGVRRPGLSVHRAVAARLEYGGAPEAIGMGGAFCEGLDEERLSQCRDDILSAAAAARACGSVCGSPFARVDAEEYSQGLKDRMTDACEALLAECAHLKRYAELVCRLYRQRAPRLTPRRTEALARLVSVLAEGRYDGWFGGTEGGFLRFLRANERREVLLGKYFARFGGRVKTDAPLSPLKENWRADRRARAVVRRLSRAARGTFSEADAPAVFSLLDKLAETEREIAEYAIFPLEAEKNVLADGRENKFLAAVGALKALCRAAFPAFEEEGFFAACVRAKSGCTRPALGGFLRARESFSKALSVFCETIGATEDFSEETSLDDLRAQAGALIENADMLPAWCMYRATAKKLAARGLTFLTDALESGALDAEDLLAAFEKKLCDVFLEANVPADAALARFSAGAYEETEKKFRRASDELRRAARAHLSAVLRARLPAEGELAEERAALFSQTKGGGLAQLFAKIPRLAARLCPCMLMSPSAVAQHLPPDCAFDLVVFDEASQMPSAEAAGAVARARAAIVAGDAKQLPPTAFFRAASPQEGPESALEDFLALGLPERRLVWHYRSKHESLIAFSNAAYYGGGLRCFPSPDAEKSRVRFVKADGVYGDGGTQCNPAEAAALVREVVRRLSDPALSASSMGVVTFSEAQREEVERALARALREKGLVSAAYDREEPLFVKNLENVQGDERDVVLFSVCYGRDGAGKLSYRFGPLNRADGWRRLNVAVSRAREEMVVFSSVCAADFSGAKRLSRGAEELKAFLAYAETGALPAVRGEKDRTDGIGKFIAEELEARGYACRLGVGTSSFRVDVGVLDGARKGRYLLGILCDGENRGTAEDVAVLQPRALARAGWDLAYVSDVNYYNNPEREIARLKGILDALSGAGRRGERLARYRRPYRAAQVFSGSADFLTDGAHDGELRARIRAVVAAEEPISRAFLKRRVLQSLGVARAGARAEARLDDLVERCALPRVRVAGCDYFYKNPRAVTVWKYRAGGDDVRRRREEDFTPFETLAFFKGALEERTALSAEELFALFFETFRPARAGNKFRAFLNDCIAYGEQQGLLVRSSADKISLA